MDGAWALPEVTEDGRFLSSNHVLQHITGADCACTYEAEQAYLLELATTREVNGREYRVNIWSTKVLTPVANAGILSSEEPPF